MAGESTKFQDCKTLEVLTQVMDRNAQQQRLQDFQANNSRIGKGFYFSDPELIQALFSQPIISETPLTVGTLIYFPRQRNIAKADALEGKMAQGVIVANLSGNNYLWSPIALIQVPVIGDQISGPTQNQLFLGTNGQCCFVPPDAGITQKVGVMFYLNQDTDRYFSIINPTADFVGAPI